MYLYVYNTSQDPPISIGGDKTKIWMKREQVRKSRSRNLVKKFDQQKLIRNIDLSLDQDLKLDLDLSLDRDLDLDLELGLCLENRPRGLPERPQSHRKSLLGGPGASWSVPVASRRCPGDVRWTLEAAQKPPSTAQGVPKSASGTPKDAAETHRTVSDWLFLVVEGLLDSSSALLQKSSFYGVKS